MRIPNRLPPALVPKHDRAAAILACRNDPLKTAVFDRMVLHMHCQAFDARVKRWSLGNGPAFEYAVEFQTKVIVQVTGGMLLNDVAVTAARGELRLWLGRSPEVTFSFVLAEAHGVAQKVDEL